MMRRFKIERSSACEADLIDIWMRVAVDSASVADHLLDRIEGSWRRLEEFPLSGISRNDVKLDVRSVRQGNYLSFYRVEDSRIVILRVLHGKRNITSEDIPG